MRLIVRPEAEADIAQAYAWYEERREGLGLEFMEEVSQCLRFIEERPLSFARVNALARRAIVRRFPYALFFIADSEEISVLAAFHMARHPAALSLRLAPDA